MNSLKIKFLLILFLYLAHLASACPRLTPNFTASYSNTCGTPRTATLVNITTGADSAVSTYRYYLDGALLRTIIGTAGTSFLITGTGNKRISMVVTDTSGCIDSSFTTVNITTTASQVRDQNSVLTYEPEWINCIQLSSTPDSFQITVSSNDTLRQPVFIWGDGNTDTYGINQVPNTNFTHWYTTTGIFTLRIVQRSGTCTDTLYGRVFNLRQPTAGLIGPSPGGNSGCVPHTVTMTNNSSNISSGTTFTWDWQDGSTSTQTDVQNTAPISHTYTANLCNGNVRLTAANACGTSFTTWNPINISDVDLANFNIDSSNCTPANPFTFNNLSADRYCLFPDSKQYYWDFGDGTNSGWINTRAAQTRVYLAEGQRTVMLIARNNCGDDTIYRTFNVVFRPTPGFTIDTSSGCGTARIFVQDTSSDFNTTRLWNFGEGTTSSQDTVTHVYNTPGTYFLTLSVTNRCGTVIARDTVNVYNLPTAGFNDSAGGCAPHTINPANLSTSDFIPPQYLWDFGNGNTSANAAAGAITYNLPGTYILKLRVTDLCGQDSLEARIVVDTTSVANIISDTVVCAFDTLFFNNNSSQYQYLITLYGDGAQDTQLANGFFFHIYNAPGNYNVIHIAQSPSGCEDRDTTALLVRSGAFASFTVNQTQACAPFTFSFTNTSLLANQYRWYVDDTLRSVTSSLNNIFVPTDSTVFRVKLWAIDSTSCFADSTEQSVFTSRLPIAQINNPLDSGCGPFFDTLFNGSQFATNYIWNFGGTSTNFEPINTLFPSATADSLYVITLRALNWMGCEDTALGNRKIYPLPRVGFSSSDTQGCGPLLVNFINLSVPNDTGSIAVMSFIWDFDNGSTSTAISPNQSFNANPLLDSTYTVRLIGFSEHGCVAQDSLNIIVYPDPTVGFTLSNIQGCGPLGVSFTNNSLPNNNGAIALMSFSWSFGNGAVSAAVNPSTIYASSLNQDSFYMAQLIGISEHGCIDSFQRNIRTFPKPLSQYTMSADSGCGPLNIAFTNLSLPYDTGDINIMSFAWDFGNGQNSNSIDTNITFADAPLLDTIYNIRLIATSEHGCLDTANNSVKVHPKPFPFFNASRFNGCGPLTVNFISTSTIANQLFWNFGNGFNLGSIAESHVFQSANLVDSLYNVQLYVTSPRNCPSDDTFSLPIVVRANPIADFAMSDDSICVEQLSLFYNLSRGANRFKWFFGTGDSSTRFNPIYNYPQNANPFLPNSYSIKLEATNFFGCVDSVSQNLFVFPEVRANFTVDEDSACAPLIVNFTNNSVNQDRSFWEFGDGDTSSALNPSHRYENYTTQNITYRAVLIASNRFGCVDYDSLNLTTIPVPFADFVPIRVNICDSGFYDFVNRSVNASNVEWYFGDGTTSTEQNPRHKYARSINQDTNYTVRFRAFNNFGCEEFRTRTISLPVRMITSFDTLPFRRVCQAALVPFNNRTTNSLYQVWYFGDGGIQTDSNPSYTYVTPGIYGVKLVSYDRNSCQDSFESAAVIEVLERPRANFTFNPASPQIPNANVFFTSLSAPNGLTHIWDFGDGNSSTNINPTNLYLDSGNYTVTLAVTNGLCADTIQRIIYIEPAVPTIDFNVSDTAGCGPFTVQFFENTLNATSFRWIFDDGQESNQANPVHTFDIPGYYNITLRAFGPGGANFLTKDSFIFVYPKPNAAFAASPRTRYLPNALFNLVDGSADAVTYTYFISHDSLPQYTYTFTDPNPQFNLTVPGYYTVRLITINALGCSDTSIRRALLFVASEGRILVPNAFTPNSDGNNEVFKPIMRGVLDSDYTFQIFDRWGMKIFQTNDINQGWDGKMKGNTVLVDAYIWLLNGKFVDGTLFEEKGNVTLLR